MSSDELVVRCRSVVVAIPAADCMGIDGVADVVSAILAEIERDHVIVERGRAERLRFAAHVYFDEYENIVQPGDLEPFPEAK